MGGFSTDPKSGGEISAPVRDKLRTALLAWYDGAGRDLPWRVKGGRADPYRVWLSEIMLQQTTVAAVGPYFRKFLELFPTPKALADAPRGTVLEAWAGLGYYSRARNLHLAARSLADSGVPTDEAGWRALPGVGPYTAAAIAAIAFDKPTNVVDGNIERVMARLHAVEAPLPAAKNELRDLAARYVTAKRPGDWAQALMDLGATVCTPKSPKCALCPISKWCAAFAGGQPETYPRRAAKAERPERHGAVFVVRKKEQLWLVRRPDQGLLGGMAGLPTTPWREKKWPRARALEHAPVEAEWERIGQVRHVFTHFSLTLDVYAADAKPKSGGFWGEAGALPTVFKKVTEL
jgi:A/G-specific adenine glycosylase